MPYRTYIRSSRKARWGLSLVLLCLQLIILTLLLHRFTSLYTPAALALFALAFAGILMACLLALWSLVQIWRKGYMGASKALLTLALSAVIMAGPGLYLPKLLALPNINDVTTDLSAPPSFETLAEERGAGSNSVIYPGEEFAKKQNTAYSDIQPLLLDRPAKESYDLIHEAITRLRWDVQARQAPGADGAAGWIEATDHTPVVGFIDDIVVRIVGDDAGTRIDVRSASRYGKHDLGRNAERIRQLFQEVQANLAHGEQAGKLKEEIKRHHAQRLQEAERKRRERAQRVAAESEAFQKTLADRQQQGQNQNQTPSQPVGPGGTGTQADPNLAQKSEQRQTEPEFTKPKSKRHTIDDWRAN